MRIGTSSPRIAIVADWLVNRGGAERCILALHEIFPEAPIYTSLYNPERLPEYSKKVVITSFLQKIPGATKKHQLFLPLMPYAFEQFDFSAFDIVISSCHSASKGIITKPRTLHVSYCHSPMRYAWDSTHEYVETYGLPSILKSQAKRHLQNIRLWDRLAADRVDAFVTNSHHVRKRIWKYYRRDAAVIHPPVELEKFTLSKKPGRYYLAVGRMTPYKRFDLVVETFNELKFPLFVVGTGRDEQKLRKMAKPNIQFLGEISDESLNEVYGEAKALVFPQTEDFGITPIEAMAAGKPVLAYQEGGALETIVPGETGIFFREQKIEDLKNAVLACEEKEWTPSRIRKQAEKFGKPRFQKEMMDFIAGKWSTWTKEMI